ncbi:MAG TPA: PAS domain S-box protein [Polaromonas sp.]|uniref:PAS domain S-box protein n=1 Tax=Polaromonas sp. TaxID=1869339 RepID=UPI002D28071B|nr:PAS domain S-box protein [Polaromonas sp.]HYW57134.1 PAS domain S-box protein [Polaromonas sp.]
MKRDFGSAFFDQLMTEHPDVMGEERGALKDLVNEVSALRRLAAMSGDWSWQQDNLHRFTEPFALLRDGGSAFGPEQAAAGLARWELPGSVALSAPWEKHREVLNAHEPFKDFEYECMSPDGVRRRFSIAGVPLFDDAGTFTGYRGTARILETGTPASGWNEGPICLMEAVIKNLPIACHLETPGQNDRVAGWNRAAEDLYGIPRDDALGKSFPNLCAAPPGQSLDDDALEPAQAADATDLQSCRVWSRSKGALDVRVRKLPISNSQGVLEGVLVASEEVSEQLTAQRRLVQSERRFESLTRLSADWYWETDTDFRFTILSGGLTPQARNVIGDFIGKTRWEIDPGEKNADLWNKHRADLQRHATFKDFEYEREEPNGGMVALSISGEPVYGDDGEFRGYRGVGTNITARNAAEAALRLSESRFRTLVGALAEGVVLRDANQRIVDCNASAERMFGKTAEQVRGQVLMAPDWQVLDDDGHPLSPEKRPGAKAVSTGRTVSNEVICLRRPDGSLLWTSVNVQPIFENNGNGASSTVAGYVVSMADITKRKIAEREVARLNVELENRVYQRTKELEAANKELEAFSYSVAHDLRSPLITIDGFCTLLEKAVSPETLPRGRAYLDRIRAGVRRMGELTDGLLALAQLSRTDIRWVNVDLSAEARKILHQHSEDETSGLLRLEVQEGMVVRGDASLLQEVLENLIANAWKFSSKKDRREILVGCNLDPVEGAVYYVRDNGAGFNMAFRDKLFIPFQRLHSVDEFSGSGIGLATVSRIILRHGGKIWAESVLDEGTTFYFTLGEEARGARATSRSDEPASSKPGQIGPQHKTELQAADSSLE